MPESQLLAAFLVGLLGGVHCVGMCGGIVGALTMTLPEACRGSPRRLLPYLVAYNGGRVLSYVAAGALVGGVGFLATGLGDLVLVQRALGMLAGLLMVALGFYLAGWWQGVARLEQGGAVLWRRLEPLGRRFLPVRTPGRAFGLGLVWGWLPCGLVYSVLVWTLTAGSAAGGAALMLAFGLGTLPTLLLLGTVAARLAAFVRRPWVRALAGALVILFGLAQLLRSLP
jgi:hypothetical protein